MENSRTKKFILSMSTGYFRQIIFIITSFITRTIFIKVLGVEYVGLTGLFSNILSILSLTELGVGSAIVFNLYKPLANSDKERIKTLMHFYKTSYQIIGLLIFGIGLLLIPLLPYIVNFEQNLDVNLYLVYILVLFNVMVSYMFFAYKQALITADQKLYKVETINIVLQIISTILDAILLIIFRNFIIYLLSKIFMTCVKNLLVANKVNKEYPFLKEVGLKKIERVEIISILKNTYSITIFKIGSAILYATDNIIISMLLGTIYVGYYSNYYLITFNLSNLYNTIILALTAGVGNINAIESQESQFSMFEKINFANFIITNFVCVSLYQLFTPFMELWLGNMGKEYILDESIVLLLVLVFYLDLSTKIYNVFRETKGLFKKGQYIQLISGILNIVISIILSKYLGLAGIFLGTVISKFFIATIPYICIIMKNAFSINYISTIIYYFKYTIVICFSAIVVKFICTSLTGNSILTFILQCFICVLIPNIIVIVIYYKTNKFKYLKDRITGIIKLNFKKKYNTKDY